MMLGLSKNGEVFVSTQHDTDTNTDHRLNPWFWGWTWQQKGEDDCSLALRLGFHRSWGSYMSRKKVDEKTFWLQGFAGVKEDRGMQKECEWMQKEELGKTRWLLGLLVSVLVVGLGFSKLNFKILGYYENRFLGNRVLGFWFLDKWDFILFFDFFFNKQNNNQKIN